MTAVPTSRYLVFFAIATVGCLIDLATKSWVFAWLGMPGPRTQVHWIWHGYVGLQTSLNEGALFGLGQGNVLLFCVLSIVAAVGILVWLFYAGAAVDWLLNLALACITAGIFGNLYDRLLVRWNLRPIKAYHHLHILDMKTHDPRSQTNRFVKSGY